MTLRRYSAALLCAALFALPMAATAGDVGMPPFPELTGPVVDGAGLLPADAESALTQKLLDYDQTSGNQLVVVTVRTLDGYPIEYWGYQLGRHWGIGDKGKSTGAILIVDKDERKLRIEVGYGLEGTLTDALSDDIIRNSIAPRFKQGDYAGGIGDGVDAILQVLGGEVQQVHREKRRDNFTTLLLMIFFAFILLRVLATALGSRSGSRLFWLWLLLGGLRGSSRGGGFGSGGFGGGGGFSGGGGSFGGGGASGSW